MARSAVVREGGLKERDDEYWRAVVGMEGPGGSADGVSIWEEDEVMDAVARVTNGGSRRAVAEGEKHGEGVDVERVGREAGLFVESVTKWLEVEGEDGSAESSFR